MNADAVTALFEGFKEVWLLIGPVAGGFLGAWLTNRWARSKANEDREAARALWLRERRYEVCEAMARTLSEASSAATLIETRRRDPNFAWLPAREDRAMRDRYVSAWVGFREQASLAASLQMAGVSAVAYELAEGIKEFVEGKKPDDMKELRGELQIEISRALGVAHPDR